MSLTVPRAPDGGGRVARIEIEAPQTGAMVAEFGARIARLGSAMEEDRLGREELRTRIGIQRELGQLRNTYAQEADPDRIDAGWQADAAALRQRIVGSADPKLRERVSLSFDAVADAHALHLGERALTLRHGQRRALEVEHGAEIVNQAATVDADTRAILLSQYDASVDDMVRAGTYSPEDGARLKQVRRAEADTAAARRAFADDPAGFAASVDAGAYPGMDPSSREGLRAQALNEVEARARAAEVEARRQASEASSATGDRIRDAVKILDEGRLPADLAPLLSDPAAQAHPDYAALAEAAQLRQAMPQFALAPPPEQARAIEAERARPVKAEPELKRLKAMERSYEAGLKAWTEDPIAAAATRMATPPPPLPAFDAATPEAQVAALRARATYARSLSSLGYVKAPAFFSREERALLTRAADVSQPPEARARLAVTLLSGFGPDAGRAIAEIGGDPVFSHIGTMMAAGGDPTLARDAFEGQKSIAAKTVAMPSDRVRQRVAFESVGALISPDRPEYATILATADAIYARTGTALDPSEDRDDVATAYAMAVQKAMGATFAPDGTQAGGAQEVNGRLTLLPMGLTPGSIEDRLGEVADMLEGVSIGRGTIPPRDPAAIWAASRLTPGVPGYGGVPVDADDLRSAHLIAIGPDRYRFAITRRGQDILLEDITTPGRPFEFSLSKLAGVRP